MLKCGDTFYAADTEDDEPHLSVVITPPEAGDVVTVSVTTRRRKSETIVCLEVGDHPFIKHPSVIAYAYSRIRSVDEIELAIKSGAAKMREPVSPELLKSDLPPALVHAIIRQFGPPGLRLRTARPA